jgi:GNAT superfamily N-acetyltransferase
VLGGSPQHYDRVVDAATLRLARLDEAETLEALMKASTRELFPLFYDEAQTASAVEFVAVVDRQLIEDGTYFAVEAGGEVVACGGWSKRGKLYTGSGDAADDLRLLDPRTDAAHVRAMFVRPDWTRRGLGTLILNACEKAARTDGFTRLDLLATLPGERLYAHFGFREVAREEATMPDGCSLPCVAMTKPL